MRAYGHLKHLELEYPELASAERFCNVSMNIDEIGKNIHNLRKHIIEDDDVNEHPMISMKERFDKIRDALPKIEKRFGVEMELVTEKCPENLFVYSNSELGDRVAQNCIENATRAGATKIIMEYVALENTVEIHIRDNGSGMDDDQLKKIGFRYSTKDGENGGNGIAIVRALVSEAGGIVEWRSIKGIGTSVIITLRKATAEEVKTAA